MSWTRREVLLSTGATAVTLAGGFLRPLNLLAQQAKEPKVASFTLPKLGYDYDALNAAIDAETMRIHHGKHHAAYVGNLNKALGTQPALLQKSIEEILRNITTVPAAIRQAVINNGGGHSNHSIFWEIMGPRGGAPTGMLAKAIDARFGSFDKFQSALNIAANTQFGSGWGWLVLNARKELAVVQRANQDSPYMDSLVPLLGIDVWEHAYYLRYKNLRAEYVTNWWKVVNWSAVADRYASALKG